MDIRRTARLALVLVLALLAATAPPVRAEEARRPKDAAEAVQEGNVKNWVEYYERTREAQRSPAKPPPAGADTPAPKELSPATAPR